MVTAATTAPSSATTNMRHAAAVSVDAAVFSAISASTSFMPYASVGGERSNSGNKSGDTALTSVWLRRLKPREDPDGLKRDAYVTSDAPNLDLDSSCGTHVFGSSLQEASTAKSCAYKASAEVGIGWKPDGNRVSERDLSKGHSRSDRQDYQVIKSLEAIRQRQGREGSMTPPYTSGFGQGIADASREERISPAKSMIINMDVDTRYASEGSKRWHTYRPNAEETPGSDAMKLHAFEGVIPASILQKPPLPPSHNKSALSQQPASYKSMSFSEWSAGRISSPPASSSKFLATAPQHILRRPSHIAPVNENLPACQAEADGKFCQDFRSKKTTSLEPATQYLPMSYHEHLPMPHHENNCSLTYEPQKKAARQDFEAMHEFATQTEYTKNLNGVETDEQASGALLKESSSIPRPLSECSVGSTRAAEQMKASAGASITASFPWEMFAGAAGPSRTAREEFVEVYNRARNELKNYKASSSIIENFNKDAETGSGAACGHGTEAEIPQKVRKAEGVECISHLGRADEKGEYDPLPQKQVTSEKYNCASYPEGDGKINPRNTPQHTFDGVRFDNDKEAGSFTRGRVGGGSHVELPAVTRKDCSSTATRYTQSRQAFASSAMPEHRASAHQEPVLQSTSEAQTGHFSCDNSRMQFGRSDNIPTNRKENHMILSKRQPRMFEAGPRESIRCEKLPRKSDAWLRRWYPPYNTTIKGSQERRNPGSIGCGQDLAGNVPKSEENNEHGTCRKNDVQKMVIEKRTLFKRIAPGTELECLNKNSAKVLPSAAAMAIVGTVAKQFCTVQSEQKGSFAFWSGFGKPAPQTLEPYAETEKGRPTVEGNPSPRRYSSSFS